MNRYGFIRAVSVIAGALLAGGVCAQGYPGKPVRVINPYAAGGGVDLLARLVAQKLQEKWAQPFVLESKPGAGGNIGMDFVAKAPPDGHTLLVTTSALATNPYFFARMPFDAERDLAPASMLAFQEFYLIASNELPVNSVAGLIAYAKANPGKVAYATPGIGTPQHLGGELLKTSTGIDIVHVPYKGQAPAIAAVLSGEVGLTWVTTNAAIPNIATGKLRGLALAALERPAAFKDVPVMAETVPGYELNTWYALFAPGGTPGEIVQQLAQETRRVVQLPDVREKLVPLGFELRASSPQELRAVVAADLAKWGKVAREAGIKPQ
jgi:tripartite-type tricarboxylate transporter receptor subunit TctC